MLSKLEEISLITKCVAVDDRRAFGRLVDEYSPGVRRFVFNLTMGDASLTDDIAQETFIKAYEALKSFRGASRFSTWLYSIACREYANTLRRRKEIPMEEHLAYTAAESTNDSYVTEMRHDIEVGLRALTPAERTLIVLFYLEDKPIKDIMRITNMPEGTIKSYLSRAKTKMAKALGED